MPAGRILLYVASLGVIGLVARSVLQGPVPIFVAAIAVTAYVAILLCGVFFLRLGMFVDAVCHGPEDARGVALTFDDGPSPTSTPKILDMLDRAGVKATFFVIGQKAEKHPDIVKDIVKRGHAIGTHSFAHHRLFAMKSAAYVRDDLAKASAALEKILGEVPVLFRPPIGHTNPTIARIVNELGFVTVGWSVRALDGLASADPKRVSERVKRGLRDGAIVLMHDASERENTLPASLKALPEILRAMSDRDLVGARLDHWIFSLQRDSPS